jgi:hypothetical protein
MFAWFLKYDEGRNSQFIRKQEFFLDVVGNEALTSKKRSPTSLEVRAVFVLETDTA